MVTSPPYRSSRNFSLPLKLRLFLPVLVIATGIAMLTAIAAQLLHGGADQTGVAKISSGKDLVADVLPPPAFLVETQLTAYRLLHAQGREKNLLLQKLAALKADYKARTGYWPGRTPWLESEETFPPTVVEGLRLLRILDNMYLPALKTGNRAKAEAILTGDLQIAFDRHRDQVEALVAATNTQIKAEEQKVTLETQRQLIMILVCGGVFLVVGMLLTWVMTSRLTTVLTWLFINIEALGRGDLTLE